MTDETKPTPNYRRLYMLERSEHIKTKGRLRQLENPPRNDEDLQRNLLSIQSFIERTPKTAGAVQCANLYSVTYLEKEMETDTRFVKRLCAMLVEQYKSDYALIEATYSRWQSLAI